ncbi:type IV pili methyl-accepting chemotaxis transducer N-terminal domain-containing protein [Yoonia sp. 2307UL14-13]|uniref:type IV pili methyl-accepting chemotaxis transducer N-terminal domain-containing protein n=1 Tax=Yoonia sp. 2307UL14-13 TaxID=3126506 RepID=UPI0030B3C817
MLKASQYASAIALSTVLAPLAVAPQTAGAQVFDPDLYEGGKARVYLSAQLRSLSEAVAATSCRLHAGVEPDAANADLQMIRSDFDTILNGLKEGNTALGIPTAENNARNLNVLEKVNQAWSPIDEATGNMINGSGSGEDKQIVSENYRDLFDLTVVLAADISGAYSDPQELLQSDATVLNFAARQQTFVNRMTRAVCGLASGAKDMGDVDELRETVDLFERSLVALRDGFPDAGINPPPNDAVKNSLSAAYDVWTARKGVFDAALAGEEVTTDMVADADALASDLSVDIKNTITLYMIAVPGQEGVYRVPLTAYADSELAQWLANPALIDAINAQNVAHTDLTEDQIIALDQTWRAEADAGGGPLITELLGGEVSAWLRDQQNATAGLVTEVFVMDNKGLNVAQSVETSDYWQGDEAKWQQTYGTEDGGLHISDVEFDDSTGFYQTQASMPIIDPTTNEPIGAITFGINIQSLM